MNYAVRLCTLSGGGVDLLCLAHQPIFVDIDVGQNQITVPGSLAAVPVERPVDPEVCTSA